MTNFDPEARDSILSLTAKGGLVWLLEVDHDLMPEPLRVVRNPVNITWAGSTWNAAGFEFEEVSLGTERPSEWQFSISNVAEDLVGFLHEVGWLRGGTCRIILVHTKHFGTSTSQMDILTDVKETVATTEKIQVGFGTANPFGEIFPRGQYWQRMCVHEFKGSYCQYDGDEETCDKQFDTCLNIMDNILHFGGTPGSREEAYA